MMAWWANVGGLNEESSIARCMPDRESRGKGQPSSASTKEKDPGVEEICSIAACKEALAMGILRGAITPVHA